MKKRIIYIDILNIVACICVVAMHCNGIVHNFSYDRAWKTSLIVETAAYWGVPIFFMITGATLLDYTKKYDTKIYMKKRILKTFFPFIVWSLFFLIAGIHDGIWKMTDLNLVKVFTMIFNSQINSVYWFFPVLFSVYLGIPVFAHLKEEKKDKIINYIIIYGIIMISIVPCLCTLFGIEFNWAYSPVMCGGYMLLALIGYRLSKTALDKKMRCVIYACGVGGWLIRFLSTLLVSLKIGELYKTFWGYYNFPTVMFSIAVFVWFQYRDWGWLENKVRLQKIISSISGCSFGVYLLHYYFVCKIPEKFVLNIAGWQWRTFGVILVYSISLVIIWIMKKIPVVKNLVP